VDLPDCDADGYYKAIQCDQSYCWCSSREGIEVAGTRQSKFNVRSRLTCSQTWYPKTTNGCSKCQTFTVVDTPGEVHVPSTTEWFWQKFGPSFQPGHTTRIYTWYEKPAETIYNHGMGFTQTGTQFGTQYGTQYGTPSIWNSVNSATADAHATATSTGGGSAWSKASSSAEVIPSNTFLSKK